MYTYKYLLDSWPDVSDHFSQQWDDHEDYINSVKGGAHTGAGQFCACDRSHTPARAIPRLAFGLLLDCSVENKHETCCAVFCVCPDSGSAAHG